MMNVSTFAWQPGDFSVVLVILLLTVGFITYWFLAESPAVRRGVVGSDAKTASSARWVVCQKLLGVFFLGVLPLTVVLVTLPYSLDDYGLGFQNTGTSLLWVFGMALVIFPLNIRAARRPQNLDYYPMIRSPHWSPRLVLINSTATTLYLLAYELLFRGILLSICTATLGVWPAVAINVALYSTTHLPKGPTETIGAIPFGLLVCYITLTTGTIWVAVVVHVILSLSNDYLSVHYNPSMHFGRSYAKESVSR